MAKQSLRHRLQHRIWRLGDAIARSRASDRFIDLHDEIVEQPLTRVLCFLLGHTPIADNCGIPEHDLCVWCMASTPGQAPRRYFADQKPPEET